MKKSEMKFHGVGYGSSIVPAVNVKVDRFDPDLSEFPGMTREYIQGADSDGGWFNLACGDGFEWLQEEAIRIFGPGVKVYSEGRNGGWAIVDGLPDFESWDAIQVSRWARFARVARGIADAVPEVMADLIYHNKFLPERAEEGNASARVALGMECYP